MVPFSSASSERADACSLPSTRAIFYLLCFSTVEAGIATGAPTASMLRKPRASTAAANPGPYFVSCIAGNEEANCWIPAPTAAAATVFTSAVQFTRPPLEAMRATAAFVSATNSRDLPHYRLVRRIRIGGGRSAAAAAAASAAAAAVPAP